ncbi:hypothetical protein GCM10018952_41620 [Streptosporangium vulgare]
MFYRWLQSTVGPRSPVAPPTAGRAHYAAPPSTLPTFYGMADDWQPVYPRPAVTTVFGFQRGRWAGRGAVLRDGNGRQVSAWDKWVKWAPDNITVTTPTDLPDPLDAGCGPAMPTPGNPNNPGSNSGLHVSIRDYTTDVAWRVRTPRC